MDHRSLARPTLSHLPLVLLLFAASALSASGRGMETAVSGPHVRWDSQVLSSPAAESVGPVADLNARSTAAYGKLPLTFVENRGQIDPTVRYVIRGPRASAFFTDCGVTFDLSEGTRSRRTGRGEDERLEREIEEITLFTESEMHSALRMTFSGASPECRAEGLGELPGKVNVFQGKDPSKWHTGIPTFGGVVYRDVWPGIDVAYHGDRRQLKYDIRVSPGSDVSDIRLCYEGTEKLWLDRKGDLHIRTAVTTFVENVPGIYQEKGGERIPLKGGYALLDDQTVGFRVTGVDQSLPLVIDPASDLVYSTFLGGSEHEGASSLAVDSSGCAYVAGWTGSWYFPTTPGAFQTNHGGYSDAFVTKLNPSGSALLYSTFLGGDDTDYASSLAVDSSGSAYVAGMACSPGFPTTPGAFQTIYGGGFARYDAFVTKLNPSGSALLYSTFLGGSDYDFASSLAVDSSGCAYVAGWTTYSGSWAGGFPTTPRAFQTNYQGGDRDAFVTKLNPSGTALLYSTFLGGSGSDEANSLAVDSSGCAYVAGSTEYPGSGSSDFPTTPGAFQTNHGGYSDAFATKLNPSGTALLYSTLLGGTTGDFGVSLALDSSGCAHVAGATGSSDFPTTPGAFQMNHAGYLDAFVTKLSPSGSALLYSTRLDGIDRPYTGIPSLAVDSSGCAYVAGMARSPGFPTTPGAFQTIYGGGFSDAFVTKLNPSGSALLYSTFLGGIDYDYALSLAVDSSGCAYVAGSTEYPGSGSSDFPTTPGAFQTNYQGGSRDAFVTKLWMGGGGAWTFPEGTTIGASNPYARKPSEGNTQRLRLKGQMHCHWYDDNLDETLFTLPMHATVTISQLASTYESLAYDFVCPTEHDHVTAVPNGWSRPITIVGGCSEVTTAARKRSVLAPGQSSIGPLTDPLTDPWYYRFEDTYCHVLGIGCDNTSPGEDIAFRDPALDDRDGLREVLFYPVVGSYGTRKQAIMDSIEAMQGLAFVPHPKVLDLGHPRTENITPEERLDLRNVHAVSIRTGCSHQNATVEWDRALASRKGRRVPTEAGTRWVPQLGYSEDDYTPPGYYLTKLNLKAPALAGSTWILLDVFCDQSEWASLANTERSLRIRSALGTGRWWSYWTLGSIPWNDPDYPKLDIDVDTSARTITVTSSHFLADISFYGVKPDGEGPGRLPTPQNDGMSATYRYSGGEQYVRVQGTYLALGRPVLNVASQAIWVYPTGAVLGPYGDTASAPARASVAHGGLRATSPGLSVEYVVPDDFPDAAPPLGYIRHVYNVSAEGGVCPPGATLTLQYLGEDVSAVGESNLRVFRWNPSISNWTPLETTADTSAQELTASITELGVYTISAVPQEDTEAPTVSFVLPSEGATITGTSWLQVSATDDLGVAQTTFYMNGRQIVDDSVGVDGWGADVDFSHYVSGNYTLTADAEDLRGNRATATREIVLQTSAVAPTVTLDTSLPSSRPSTPTFALGGTASDADGFVVGAVVEVNGKLAGVAEIDGDKWTCQADSSLVPGGAYQVSVKAMDDYGNVGGLDLDTKPRNVSVSPSTGTFAVGSKFTLSTQYSDPNGNADLAECSAIVNNTFSAGTGIYVSYTPQTNKLYLYGPSGWLPGVTPGTATTLENDRAIIYCDETTIARSGNSLTVNWRVAFKTAMKGRTCNVWMQVKDRALLSDGWDSMGSNLTVAGDPPTNVSVSPSTGTFAVGGKFTLSTQYSDPNGNADLAECSAIVNSTFSAGSGIYVSYTPQTNKLYLYGPSGWLPGVAPGTAATLENDRVIVYCDETTIVRSGSNLTVNWRMAFRTGMKGKACNVWMQAKDRAALVDGWDSMGANLIVPGEAPANVSVSPASGTYAAGSKFTLATAYSDPNGYVDLAECSAIVNNTLSAGSGIYVSYTPLTNKLYLYGPSGWLPGVTPGSATTLENDRVIVYCDETTITKSGNSMVVNWRIAFKSGMSGKTCNAWMQCKDRAAFIDGWEPMGASLVVQDGSPVSVSVFPKSGTCALGSKLTLSTAYSDPNGYGDLAECSAIMNSTFSVGSGIYLAYTPQSNKLYLYGPSGWLPAVTPGTATTLENDRVIVYCGETTVSKSGASLTVNWRIAFKAPMAERICNVWMQAKDKSLMSDPWEPMGASLAIASAP